MTVPGWRLTQPELDVLAEALAHPGHEVTAGEAGWSLVRRGLLTLTFGGEPEDIAAHVRSFKLTEAGVLCAQGRLDFVRDRFTLWHPVLNGKELLDISRCHQKEVCETIGRYVRGGMRRELDCLEMAFRPGILEMIMQEPEDKSLPSRHLTVGPFPQEPAFESEEAIRQAAETVASHDGFGERLFTMNGCQCASCRKRREWFGPSQETP